jgi:multidrug efflux pump subunit AcrB
MQLPALAIRNHQFTIVLFLLLVMLGVVSFFTMPRSEDPQFDFSAVVIKVVSPGTIPMDMEKLVVDPVEAALNELEDIKNIKTDVEDGLAVIRIEFLYGTDPDEKYDEVVASVARIRSDLPSSIVALKTDKISPADVNILQLALVSEQASYAELKRHAEALEQRLERASGVKRVDVEALPELEVQIQVDQRQVNALGISLDEIFTAVQSAAQNLPGGHANGGDRRFTVRTSGDYQSLQQIEDTVIRGSQGKFIYLRDIATISQGETLPTYRAKLNGEKAVFVSVVQRRGSQIFNVMEGIQDQIDLYKPRIPSQITLLTVMDQSVSVERQISGFFNSLNQGLILVAILSIIVLGFKPSLVVVSAVPLSIFIAIGWVDLAGFGLQQMSIVGLVIALGLLVDNAIVVVENVSRHLREGDTPKEAAVKGSSQVAWAVASGTLTTVLSFLPMLFLQNGSGTFMRAMPVTVVVTLFASLLIALTLTPLLASKLGSSAKKTTRAQKKLESIADTRYSQVLMWALDRPGKVMGLSVLILVSSLALFPYIGVSLFPKAEKPMILVNIDMPEGSTFARTQEIADEVSNRVRQHELVKDVAQNVGRGNPRIYYNIMPTRQTVNFAQLFVTLHDFQLSRVEPLVDTIRREMGDIAGAKITVKEFNQGPGVEAPISIRVVGEELVDIQRVALDVEKLVANTEGTVGIDNPIGNFKIDLKVEVNRDKAAMLGVPLQQIDSTVRTALVGTNMGSFRDNQGEIFPLVLRLSQYENPQIETFEDIEVRSNTGQLIPLLQIAELNMETSIARFQHYDLERMARITADVLPGFTAEKVTNNIIAQLENYDFPEGVHYSIGGEQENRKEAFGGMAKTVLLAVFGIFAVLVLQFRSFVQPLIVFAAIPFALVGAFIALFISGYTFSFTAFIGLTSLVGIVVNNSIILVDYANQMRLDGLEKIEAIMAAAKTRFVPIILTTLTTVGGLLPLTLSGSSMWSPMGWAIIGGLLVSTLLTLIVVPVLYKLLGKMPEDSEV